MNDLFTNFPPNSAEQAKLQAWTDEFRKLTGIATDVVVQPFPLFELVMGGLNTSDLAANQPFPDGPAYLLYYPGVIGDIPDDQIKGSILHELGHIKAGDTLEIMAGSIPPAVQRKKELAADAFAARYGYGPALATMIKERFRDPALIYSQVDPTFNFEKESTHPGNDERVRNILATPVEVAAEIGVPAHA